MADGTKVTKEQLAMVDQLNQKLASAQITAAEYAEAIREAGLEAAHSVTILDQHISKAQQLVALYQEMGGKASEVRLLEQQIVQQEEAKNAAMATGNAARREALRLRKEAKNETSATASYQKELEKSLQQNNVWGASFISQLAEGKSLSEQIVDTMSQLPEKIGAGIFNDFVAGLTTVVMQGDSMVAQFNQATGAAGALDSQIMTAHVGMSSMGVSMENTGSAATALYTSFNRFSSENAATQTGLIQTTASLEKLGVASETTANNMALATNAFGMTTAEANNLQTDLAKTALAVGMPPAQMAGEFAKAAPQLAAYGKKGIEVFKNMAAVSKGLGMEMSSLLGITEQFDTFEGAAQAAGSLNAMLGGDLLNSMDLLNATEDERIRMILQATEASGKQWSTMGKFEKKAIANAAGITDMAEANKLFGGGLSGYDEALRKAEENAASQAELEEAMAAASSITDKMKMAMSQLAVAAGPIINVMRGILDGVLAVNDAFGGYLIPVVLGGIAAFYAVYKIMQMVTVAGRVMAAVKLMSAGASMTEAAAEAGLTTVKGAATAACGSQTLCEQGNTAAKVSNTTATNLNVLASLRSAAARGIEIAKTVALWVWEKAMYVGRLALAGVTTILAMASTKLGIGQGVVAATSAPAAAGTAAVGTASWYAVIPVGLLAIGLGLLAVSFGLVAMAVAMIVGSFVELISLFMQAPGAALMAAGALVVMGYAIAIVTAIFAALAPIAPMAMTAMIMIGIGMLALAVPTYILAAALSVLGAAMATGGFDPVGMMAFAVSLVFFSVMLLIAAPFMMLAAVLFAPAALLVGFGLLLIGLGISYIVPHAANMGIVGEGLVSLAWSLLGAAFPMLLAGIFFAPAAILVGTGLFLIGMGLKFIVKYRRSMKTVGKGLKSLAWSLLAAAPALALAAVPLLVAGVLLFPAGLLLGLGLMMLGKGVGAIVPYTGGMAELALVILPFAIAMALAGIPLFIAGIFMLFAGGPFMLGAMMIAAGLAAFAPVIPFLPNLMLIAPVALAMALAGPAFMIAGIAMMLAGPAFIIGAVMIAIGMMILNGPLMQFAQAVALMGPFIPVLPILALGLIMLGLALPIFGMGLLILGIIASMPFFDTGLEVLTTALYTFADAMSGIPTEKAKALGQIFQGLSAMTDMEGMGSALYDFSVGIFWLGWGLSSLPDGETLKLMGEGLKAFVEGGAKHVLPVSIALYAAAPYLHAAALRLEPAAFALYVAGKPLSVGMYWISIAFSYMGESEPKKGLQAVAQYFLPAAVGLFIGAPLLFFASLWLFLAGPFWLTGAFMVALGMAILNEPLRDFAFTMMLLAPNIQHMVPLAYALFVMGVALPTFAKGLRELGRNSWWWGDPKRGLSLLGDALYLMADAMSDLPTEKAMALGYLFHGLAEFAALNQRTLGRMLHQIAVEIGCISDALQDIPDEALVKMMILGDYVLDPLAELATNLTPDVAVNAGALVDEAERYAEVQASMKNFAEDAFAQMVVAQAKAAQAQAEADKARAENPESGEGGPKDVVLMLNEREFGRAVEVFMNKRINLSMS